MDIAFVTTRLVNKDAQGNFSEATLRALRAVADKVTLYTFAYDRPPIEGVEVRFLGGKNAHSIRSNVSALARTGQLARELSRHDIILLVGPDAGALPAVHAAKKRNPQLRLLWVYHGLTPGSMLPRLRDKVLTGLRRAAYLRSMRKADVVKTDSEYTKLELVQGGVDGAKIVAMPIGIDLDRYAAGSGERIRKQLKAEDSFVVLYVGRLAKSKRVDLLIKAVERLKAASVRLVVVGGGPEQQALEGLAASLQVADKVTFAGRVADEELADYYAACDVWATASEHEGFCVPIVEAMGAGKPVVVPRVSAMPETAGNAGLIYEPGDLGGLVAHLNCLREDRRYYDTLVGYARTGAEYYDFRRVMPGYVKWICSGGRK